MQLFFRTTEATALIAQKLRHAPLEDYTRVFDETTEISWLSNELWAFER